MRNLVCAATLSIFFSTTVLGTWAWIPLAQLVPDSDLIIIGTLHSAAEDAEGIGNGYILVERIMTRGVKTLDGAPLQPGANLKINWADDWACAMGMHRGREGKRGVWLLKIEDDGTVDAAYPGRFVGMEELNDVERLLRKRPVKNSARVDILNEDWNVSKPGSVDTGILPDVPVAVNSLKAVDTTPFDDYSHLRALITLLFSFGLYVILYRSRFRIR